MNIEELKYQRVIIGTNSLSVYDENGKRLDGISEYTRYITATPEEMQEIYNISGGAAGKIGRAGYANCIVAVGKSVYYLHDLGYIESLRKGIMAAEKLGAKDIAGKWKKQIEDFNALAIEAEKAVTVIPCYITWNIETI